MEFKIDGLYAGQIIKNNRELCEILGVKYTTSGKGQKYNVRELERYCRFHKEGYKYIIDEVYIEPLPKIDNRINNGGNIANTTYGTLLDGLLLDWFFEENIDKNNNILIATFNQIFIEKIPMFSIHYDELIEDGIIDFMAQHGLAWDVVNNYRLKLKNIVEKCLKTSLNRLQREGLIKWSREVMVNKRTSFSHVADIELADTIQQSETATYKKMGITGFDRVNPQTNKQFTRRVCALVNERVDDAKEEIISFWRVYRIEIIKPEKVYPNAHFDEDIKELSLRLQKSVGTAARNKIIKVKKKKTENEDTAKKVLGLPKPENKNIELQIKMLNELIWEKY